MTSEALFVEQDLEKIRKNSPLVHNITNFVVMNLTANALLAAGASPVMAHAIEEVEDMVGIANALVVNIGTLSTPWVEAMFKAGREAKRKGIPVIFDPVGAGATRMRTETAISFVEEIRPEIVRGNASEILALHRTGSSTKGVDSLHGTEDALEAARDLAAKYGTVVSISGAVDLIVDKTSLFRVHNGHPLMPRVTGLGCTASSLTGAFAAVDPSLLQAAAAAMAVMGVAGEIAASQCRGPASFQIAFLDTLYNLDAGEIRARLKMEME